ISASLAHFRELFGDERRDYQGALQLHHQNGPPAGWQMHYISSYASMHPWEDWAECWAHYMHMVDTLETAHDFGRVSANTEAMNPGAITGFNPAHETFPRLLDRWVRMTVTLNAISHSMGLPDTYPFVLPPMAQRKLEFIHGLIAGQ
ncbi:MAG: putative zinc-binding metallopeptidase, partial [Nevskiales bacterium]